MTRAFCLVNMLSNFLLDEKTNKQNKQTKSDSFLNSLQSDIELRLNFLVQCPQNWLESPVTSRTQRFNTNSLLKGCFLSFFLSFFFFFQKHRLRFDKAQWTCCLFRVNRYRVQFPEEHGGFLSTNDRKIYERSLLKTEASPYFRFFKRSFGWESQFISKKKMT